ncbi:hypothetical protein TNCV_1693141 [Trichonephila clavipes]|nr:hypothetical protein TNCV_1693141 [Trichonephila clavipes]
MSYDRKSTRVKTHKTFAAQRCIDVILWPVASLFMSCRHHGPLHNKISASRFQNTRDFFLPDRTLQGQKAFFPQNTATTPKTAPVRTNQPTAVSDTTDSI